MKQVVRVLSTYSADLFGINSVLYELGGLVVMHDASGCNSTYNTHDEPRWYTTDSMIYISGLKENDVILGNDEKLIEDICETAAETHPAFIAVTAALIPLFMSTDMKGLARVIERRTGIPSFGFTTNAMDTYISGGNMVYGEFLERFCPDERPGHGSNKLSVNLLGVTPLDFSIIGNVEALRSYLEDNDIAVNCCMTMGCSLDEITAAGKADVNLLCSSLAENGALLLREKYGMPYVTGLPAGRYAAGKLAENIRQAASGADDCSRSNRDDASSFSAGQHAYGGVWIIGEVVFAASVRECLENDLGLKDVHVICPGERSCGLLRPGDVMTHEEEDIENCLAQASAVIADPIYRRIMPRGWRSRGVKFADIPHEAYSGRMYRSRMPLFIGAGFTDVLQDLLCTQREIGMNDIMKNNVPFAKKKKY
ncbi:MAG: nitrogenase component 1 [Eubacteriaceae bacterium]|jgi:hypothetical protein|nr:nitrogenase component 1 [Eubacteriaceae bacterium]